MTRPIMILAGGTGGHIFPALAVAAELMRMGKDVVWVGAENGMEAKVVPQQNIRFISMRVQGLRRSGWRRYLKAPLSLMRALLDAVSVVRQHRPCAVLGMGGFVSGPCGLVSALFGIPLILHEQNSIPGLTNRILAPFSRQVFAGFPIQFKNAMHCGNPVRKALVDVGKDRQQTESSHRPLRLLVLGGSQGARVLNQTVPAALVSLSGQSVPEVWHQAGRGNEQETVDAYHQCGVAATVSAFIDDMDKAYQWADLVVCRSGAMTLAELSAVGLPSVLVPYPYAVDDHQTRNAQSFVDAGAAVLLPESELCAHSLATCLEELLKIPGKLTAMGAAAAAMTHPDAAERIASACIEACEGRAT